MHYPKYIKLGDEEIMQSNQAYLEVIVVHNPNMHIWYVVMLSTFKVNQALNVSHKIVSIQTQID